MCIVTAPALVAAGWTSATAGTALAINVGIAVSMAASIAMTAYGQVQAADARKKQADYQAKVAENNAKVGEWEAQDALDRGRIAEQQHRLKVSQLKGQQRSALAASGVELDSGSALDVLSDTAYFGEMDALTIRSNSERQAWKARVGASNSRAESTLLTASGQQAVRAGNIGAVSSSLSSAASYGLQGAAMATRPV
mgnify:CR=1 FL=1